MQIIIYSFLVLALTSYSTATSFRTDSLSSSCPIKLYNPGEPSLFTGEQIYANVETFHPLLDVLADYAKRCHLRLRVKRSYVKEPSALSHSMRDEQTGLLFQLGEAIEVEPVNKMNKVICDRMCMKFESKSIDRNDDAKCFIRKMENDHRFEQDRSQPNIFMIRSKSIRTPKKLDQRRRDLQNSCERLRRNKFF